MGKRRERQIYEREDRKVKITKSCDRQLETKSDRYKKELR